MATAASAAGVVHVSRSTVAFGYTPLFVNTPVQPVFVTNVGAGPLTITGLTIAGAQADIFTASGTCAPPVSLDQNEQCRIDLVVQRKFTAPVNQSATLTLTTDGAPATTAVALAAKVDPGGIGVTVLAPTPAWLEFGAQPVGVSSAPLTLNLLNVPSAGISFVAEPPQLSGGDAADFALTSTCGAGTSIPPGHNCSYTVTFTPQGSGPRSTELVVQGVGDGVHATYVYSVTGFGGAGGAPATVTVVEYYWAARDHYFITADPAGIAFLDAQPAGGWVRTGKSFQAFAAAGAGLSPVCRFYLPPEFGDSHFYGRGTAECELTRTLFPGFIYESPAVMYMVLPNLGTCAAGTIPVYRAFDGRADTNHRYTTDRAVRDQMVLQGWIAEGDGPDQVVMCAPG